MPTQKKYFLSVVFLNKKAKTDFETCLKMNYKFKTEITHLHKYYDPLLSTLLKHLWHRVQPRVFMGMTLQAWHTCIWGVSPIFLCSTSQDLSSWMGSVAAQLFSGLSRDVQSVQVQALAGQFKDIQRHVLKPFLLDGEPSPPV